MCPKCKEEMSIEGLGFYQEGPEDFVFYYICQSCGHEWEERD